MRKFTCYNGNKEGHLVKDCRGPRKPRRNPEQGKTWNSSCSLTKRRKRFLEVKSDNEQSEPLQVMPKLVNGEILKMCSVKLK